LLVKKGSGKVAAKGSGKVAAKESGKVAAKIGPKVAAKTKAASGNKTRTPKVDANGKKIKSDRNTRNPLLARGINRFSRSAIYHKNGSWANKNWKKIAKKAPKKVTLKTKPFGGGTRVIKPKAPRFHPADDVPHPLHNNRTHHKKTALRASITPGTILILLVGRFRSHRVVFLKQLPSGLLLVTGPFQINGVPLKRVCQTYVIATSTKVDISGLDLKRFTDKYFRRPKAPKTIKNETNLFEPEKKVKVLKPHRVADQKNIDSTLVPVIKKVPDLEDYLRKTFSLDNKHLPHEMKF